MEKKKELRKRIALLKTLHKSTATHQSAEILAALEAHPVFRAASIILLYHSLPDEVHTHDFIRKWSTKKKILLPVVIGNDLELRVYTSPADLAIGAYGIEEPTGALFTDYATIDLVIVPGVAFDRDEAGRRTLAALTMRYGERVTDRSSLYDGCKDLNEYLQLTTKKQKNNHLKIEEQ